MPGNFLLHKQCRILFLSCIIICSRSFSQCSVQIGPPPPASNFNTGNGGRTNDAYWQIAKDSITGPYNPAVVMSGLPDSYHNNSRWISFSTTGEHSGNRYFFYKRDFELPCFDQCGRSYNDANTFCLNLDLYADNSIFEIYVNGIPQSPNLGGVIPLSNPFNPVNHTENDKTSVSLCKDWKAGSNTLVIVLASSATVAGIEVEASLNPPPPPDADTAAANICSGETYNFGNLQLTKSGYYFQTFSRSSGCDSNVVLNLTVYPVKDTVINQTICDGQSFEGHSASGIYTTTYTSSAGCDSTSTLNLTVTQKPQPYFGNNNAVCEGDSLILSPGVFASYMWQDGSINDHYIVKKPGLYSVTVTNACGTANAQVIVTKGVCGVYFPTAFTPNGDGKNDYFKILTNLSFEKYDLAVYNRYGQKVFESTNPSVGWDGTYKGAMLAETTFVWYCTFKRQDKEVSMKGTVILIR